MITRSFRRPIVPCAVAALALSLTGCATVDEPGDALLVGADEQAVDPVESYSLPHAPQEATGPVVTCVPDAAEPDDADVDAVTADWDSPMGRTACIGDVDFFVAALEAGRDVRLDVPMDRSEGDVEVAVMAPSGDPVAVSEIHSDRAVAEFTAPETGEYVFRVVMTVDVGVAEGTSYTLRLEDPHTPCQPDAYEPNDDSGTAAEFTFDPEPMFACEQDEDWFLVWPGPLGEISVVIESDPQQGDVDFAVYDAGGTYRGGAFGEDPIESFFDVGGPIGPWSVRVYLADGSQQGVPYVLETSAFF